MPTLNWIGKEAVIKHHKAVPFRLVEPVDQLSCGDNNGAYSGNLVAKDAADLCGLKTKTGRS